ncbi:luciferase family protein [Nocardia tengchongensis]|uniref:luciferase domain-containing protein n=1 Tax=Nocardia tengchongensis TaxID=2055889 RepID=UPI0033F8FA87
MTVTATDRLDLPRRGGERPRTRPHNPHQQLSDIAPPDLQEALWARMITLPGTQVGRSRVSLPDTRALYLLPELAHGPEHAFVAGTEFAHLHGRGDGSLHLCLPVAVALEAIEQGWAEQHPMARRGYLPPTLLMVYGPRDADEVAVVWRLIRTACDFARGAAPRA